MPIPDKKCCPKIKFIYRSEDFDDKDLKKVIADAPPIGCGTESAPCNDANRPLIRVNASIVAEERRGQWKVDNRGHNNLIPVIQHEIGHTFGLFHFEDCPGSERGYGVMNASVSYPPTREKLTKDDKCYFKMLYCPNGPIGDVNNGNQISMNLPPYPNPARDIVNIKFSLKKPSSIKIVIYNAKGEKIYTALDVDNFPAGENSIYYNTLLTENGNYFYTVETGTEKRTEKFVVQR